jgi:hypothetical protein
MKKYKLKNNRIYKHKMLKLSLGILFIVTLFEPTIQQYSDEYCAKYVATFPLTMETCIDNSSLINETSFLYKIMNNSYLNKNCSGSGLFALTYSPEFCKNNMIISPIIPAIPSKKVNWNEYIVLSGSNFASDQKNNIIKSVKIPVEEKSYSQLVISEFLFAISAFLFTINFIILMVN